MVKSKSILENQEEMKNLCYIFSEIKDIVSQILEIELDCITLDSDIQDDLSADNCDAVEIIMALEKHFEVEIQDDYLEEVNIVIQPSFSWWSLSNGNINNTHYLCDFTISKLVDWIDTIKNNEIELHL